MVIEGTKITMIRGDTESLEVSVTEDGEPRPLVAGDVVHMTVKQRATDTDIAFQKVIRQFVDGVALINIEHEDTKDLRFGNYVYDIQVTFADSTVKTVVGPAAFVLALEVTHE